MNIYKEYEETKDPMIACPHCKNELLVDGELKKLLDKEIWLDVNRMVVNDWPEEAIDELEEFMKPFSEPREDIIIPCPNCGKDFILTWNQESYLCDIGYHNAMVSMLKECLKMEGTTSEHAIIYRLGVDE